MPEIVPQFKIRELTGKQRTVILTKRALPYRPISFDGEQRVDITNPAGMPIGTSTVLGPTEGSTSIDGFWKEKFLGATDNDPAPFTVSSPRTIANNAIGGDPITTASECVAIMDSIRREGQLLEVSWGYIVRRGHLKKFTHKWHNIYDIEWSCEFVWTSQGELTDPPTFPNAASLNTGSNLLTILDNITNALNGDIVRAMRPELLDDIRRYSQKIAALSEAIDNVTNVAVDLVTSPLTVTRSVLDSCGSILQVTNDLQDKVLSKCTFDWFQSAKKLVSPGASSIEPEQDVDIQPTDMNAMRDLQRQIAQENRRLRDEAESQRRAIATPIEQLLTTYRARDDESVREVSQRFYGSPDHWREIMDFNDLQDSTLYAGQPILIPRL